MAEPNQHDAGAAPIPAPKSPLKHMPDGGDFSQVTGARLEPSTYDGDTMSANARERSLATKGHGVDENIFRKQEHEKFWSEHPSKEEFLVSDQTKERPRKRIKSNVELAAGRAAAVLPHAESDMKTPDMAAEQASRSGTPSPRANSSYGAPAPHNRAPFAQVKRNESSASVSSDISSASSAAVNQNVASYKTQEGDADDDDDEEDDQAAFSPIPRAFVQEVPPAPPSTPASSTSTLWDCGNSGVLTPLPIATVKNAQLLEEEQMLMDGAVTPAPPRDSDSASERPLSRNIPVLPGEFEDWAVGDRYEMVRILGRGSYGEVAQARDLSTDRPDAFVAIKRIQSPFDQEVDAIRLYREMHILRHMRGHDCIIQLLNVIQPPTDDLDDFHDLYLVFECEQTIGLQ